MPSVKDLDPRSFGFRTKKELKELLSSRGITLRGRNNLTIEQATNYIIGEIDRTNRIVSIVSAGNTVIEYNQDTNEASKIVVDKKEFIRNFRNRVSNIQYKSELNPEDTFSGALSFTYSVEYSHVGEIRDGSIFYEGLVGDIHDFLYEHITSIHPSVSVDIEILSAETIPVNQSIPMNYNFNRMTLSDTIDNLILSKYVDNLMVLPKRDGTNTCVYDFLNWGVSKHIDVKKYDKENIVLSDVINDLEKHKIPITIYDVDGNVIKNITTPDSRIKKLYCIVHNNHLYPMRNKLNSIVNGNTNVVYEKNCNDKFKEIIMSGIEPFDVKLKYKPNIDDKNVYIKSFKTNDSIYVSDEELFNFIPISKKIDVKIDYDISSHSMLFKKLMELNSDFRPYSTIPESFKFIKSPIVYRNENVEALYSRDGNSFYIHIAKSLPFLIKCDYTTDEPCIYTDEPIIDHNLYLCEPIEENFLINDRNIYSGIFIKEVMENFPDTKFKILEYINCSRLPNVFTKFIDDIQSIIPQIDPQINQQTDPQTNPEWKTIKTIITKMFGIFQMSKDIGTPIKIEYDGIFTEFEMNTKNYNFDYIPINEKYNLKYHSVNQPKSIKTLKPIGMMIMDFAKLEMMKFMKINGIKLENIAQIKTDSIYTNIPFKTDPSKIIGQFKEEKICEKKLLSHTPLSIENLSDVSLFPQSNAGENCTIVLQYAGAGKTYTIINEIIPSNPNYIVLCSRHKALDEYRKYKLNHSIICASITETFMEYDTIIVDEIGMVDRSTWKIIINLILAGKKVICYGDFNQFPDIDVLKSTNTQYIPPKDRPLDYNTYIPKEFGTLPKTMIYFLFNKVDMYESYVNHRNDFTIAYYNSLIKKEIDPVMEIMVNSTPIEKLNFSVYDDKTRDHIITYTKESRNVYNGIIMKKLGFPVVVTESIKKVETAKRIGNDVIRGTMDVTTTKLSNYAHKNVRLIADLTDNPDSRKNDNIRERDIYNGMIYFIVDSKGDTYTLNNGSSFSKKEIEKYFQPAYAINIHKLQGIWVSNYGFPIDDKLASNRFINIIAYVTISRLRTKYGETPLTPHKF